VSRPVERRQGVPEAGRAQSITIVIGSLPRVTSNSCDSAGASYSIITVPVSSPTTVVAPTTTFGLRYQGQVVETTPWRVWVPLGAVTTHVPTSRGLSLRRTLLLPAPGHSSGAPTISWTAVGPR